MPSFDLTGKRALVTGANTGLGQGIAVALAEAGAELVLVGRSAATETLEQIASLNLTDKKHSEISADLNDLEVVQDLIRNAEERGQPVDILVNNAGIISRANAIDFTEHDWDSVMDVNLKSVFFLAQAFAKSAIAAERSGKIINIASMLSYQGGIRVASYTSSKSGVMGLTRLLANEWASKGINVNAIAPGYFATNNTAALQADKVRNAQILERIPAGHWGKPEELGGAAVFLSSSAADYVHGITLPVDGGWLAR